MLSGANDFFGLSYSMADGISEGMPFPDPDLDQGDDLAIAIEFYALAVIVGGAFIYGILNGLRTLL